MEDRYRSPPHISAVRKARVFARSTVQPSDGLVRENFMLPRDEARLQAKSWLQRYPKAAYWSRVESWQRMPDDTISFTMVRLPSAD